MCLVSVIMPAFNSEDYISIAVESVLSQTYEDIELIVIDDCSTDSTLELVIDYQRIDPRVKIIRLEKNGGVATARNEGIKVSKGRFVAFLDSDDVWLPSKLERQIAYMLNGAIPISYCAYYTIDKNGTRLNLRRAKGELSFVELLKSNSIGNLTGVFDSYLVGRPKLKEINHEDYVFWLDLLSRGFCAKGLNEPLAEYRVIKGSLSSNKLKVLNWQWSIYREYLGFSLGKSVYYFLNYIVGAFRKRF